MISIYETAYRKLRFGVYGGMVKPLSQKSLMSTMYTNHNCRETVKKIKKPNA